MLAYYFAPSFRKLSSGRQNILQLASRKNGIERGVKRFVHIFFGYAQIVCHLICRAHLLVIALDYRTRDNRQAPDCRINQHKHSITIRTVRQNGGVKTSTAGRTSSHQQIQTARLITNPSLQRLACPVCPFAHQRIFCIFGKIKHSMIPMPLLLPLTRQPSAAFLLCRYFTKNRDKTTDKAAKNPLFLMLAHLEHLCHFKIA